MAENDTLLAYLVSSFPGNTENIATEALKHILSNSNSAIEALNDVVRSGVYDLKPIIGVRTQVVSTDGTRPDLVGFDEGNMERVMIEVKFRADLTERQPNGYLNRLPGDGPAVLVFLTPDDRIKSLWPVLKSLVEQAGHTLSEVESERKCVRVGDTQRHLMMVSWMGLLDSMATRVRDAGENLSIENDIRQLRTLAKYADLGAFKPIRRDENFGADSDRLKRDLERLIDAATEQGISEDWISKKGLNRAKRSYGYGRYLMLGGKGVWFGVNYERFEETSDTPLWINVTTWEAYASKFKEKGITDAWIPINLPREVEYPAMLDGVVEDLRRIAGEFQSIMAKL